MTGILTAGGEVKRGGNQTKSLVFLDFLRWRVSPRAASGGGAWSRRAAIVLQLQKSA